MVGTAGKKRASPGADVEKNSLSNVELSDEDAQKLQVVQKEIARTELLLERRAQEALVPVFEKRRAVAKTISKFWPVALLNHNMFGFHAQHTADQQALSYLEDLWVTRDSKESRAFTIEMHFKENPYFSDSVLKKEFKYVSPPAASEETADADGITESMLDFSWDRDIVPSATKINWKDPETALTKLHPRVRDDEGDADDLPAESGSFFNFFEVEADPFEVGTLIANEIFPEATDYFLGTVGGDELDSDEEDSDDDADEIDLEKPKTKKQKQA
jgi:template-activating factor I